MAVVLIVVSVVVAFFGVVGARTTVREFRREEREENEACVRMLTRAFAARPPQEPKKKRGEGK
ncbi:MAG: hypothetical protein A2493_02505 [Candidatus Magasanikbacteria bacterium RIFOXYC12_FULL_33_11]|uniref:Uncharacterized protein n=1 Tax=Candidatus Magasanikbacteria bacterium RIFOXYC12_FULL_33_11 TaxID=1798701 RepID=A0A1F6NQ80_9BACT|nr:MAG: hypothetical protein A2493_02505 [Candidatus Magasanikbacteria bacterium RIFOXYC12_FULL_33_11]